MSILRKILSKLTKMNLSSFLFPHHCTLCKADGVCLCVNCENALNKIDKNINNWTYVCYNYKDQQVKKLLYRVKYHHNPELAKLVGSYVQKSFQNFLLVNKIDSNHVLVPIPLSKNRMNERRYNQASEIAVGLADNPALVQNVLLRKKDTKKLHQSQSKTEREDELHDAFEIDKTVFENINNTKYILIDDISTTGTTLFEARRTLVNAGIPAENVFAFVLAH